ncbi:MAG: DNA polymerase III subunit delta [Clostridia bacterium]|nr:DNA polymerase III subunit delta [Clostridia bacterium]
MAEINEATLKKQVDSGAPERVYFLYGEEKKLVRRAAGRIMEAFGGTFEDFNLQKFPAEATADDVHTAVEALPFMSEFKCVAVADMNFESMAANELAKFKEIIANVPESTVLVFWYPTLDFEYKKAGKWKTFLTQMGKTASLLPLGHMPQAELEKYLCARAAKRKCELPRKLAGKMIEYAGSDLQVLESELEKLCAFALETAGGAIDDAMVEKLTTQNMETTVFKLTDAIVAGQFDRAYGLLDMLFYQNEEPIGIVTVLGNSFIDMYRVRAALQGGKTSAFPAEYENYRGREFRLKNAERDVRRLSTDVLRECLAAILAADLSLKSSRTPPRIVVEELLAKLLLITKKQSAI